MTATKVIRGSNSINYTLAIMNLICFENAGVEHGLTIDSTYQELVKPKPAQRDTLVKVKDDTGRINLYRRNRFIELKHQLCHDCGCDTLNSPRDYYMVHDEVWKQYGLGSQPGMLCMNCLEKRLGQPLQAHHLMLCPLNITVNPYTQQILWAYCRVRINYQPIASAKETDCPVPDGQP